MSPKIWKETEKGITRPARMRISKIINVNIRAPPQAPGKKEEFVSSGHQYYSQLKREGEEEHADHRQVNPSNKWDHQEHMSEEDGQRGVGADPV